jgi:hypothetical protein
MLVENVLKMSADSALGDAEHLPDLLVRQPCSDQAQYLTLSFCYPQALYVAP